jgi:hypothetical protein
LYALALETTIPGFPDVQIIDNDTLLLIETKCVTESEWLHHNIISKFEDTQPVFYKEHFNRSNNDNLFGLIQVQVGKNKRFVAFKITERLVDSMYKGIIFKDISQYVDSVDSYVESVDLHNIIKWFRTFL